MIRRRIGVTVLTCGRRVVGHVLGLMKQTSCEYEWVISGSKDVIGIDYWEDSPPSVLEAGASS